MAPNISNNKELNCDELWNLTLGDFHSMSAEKKIMNTPTNIKCALVGDGAVGKTSLAISYSTNGYPNEYIPTAFDHYTVKLEVDDRPVQLQISDTAGQDDFDHIRPLAYPGCEVILVCFSVIRPTSLCNVKEKWLPELKKYLPKVPVILVGTQTDLRDDLDILVDLSRYNKRPITEQEGCRYAKECGASSYVECSALTQKNLKEVFDVAILEALDVHNRKGKKRSRSSSKKSTTSYSRGSTPQRSDDFKAKREPGRLVRKFFCLS